MKKVTLFVALLLVFGLQTAVAFNHYPVFNSRSDCLAYYSGSHTPVSHILKICNIQKSTPASVSVPTNATAKPVNTTLPKNNTVSAPQNITTTTILNSIPANITKPIVVIPLNNTVSNNSTQTPIVQSSGIFGASAMTTNIWMDNIPSQLAYWRAHKIKYLVVDVGDTAANGLISTPKDEILSFINDVSSYEKQTGYNFIALPYSEVNTDNYNFNDAFAANMVKDYQYFVSIGFDGAYVDVEPVKLSQRTLYINFLKQLKATLPQNATTAVYSANLDESSDDWAWPYAFFRQVSNYTNVIELQGYDEGFSTSSQYQAYLVNQMKAVSAKNWTSAFMLGVPTHNPAPETLSNAIAAYKAGLSAYPANPFIGVSIFAEWTITQKDWATFENMTGIKA
jgi:hypothetical protein